jgi:DNA polymerase (family X)
MNNRKIADSFLELGNLMELHGEPDFKTKSYGFAYRSLKKWEVPLEGMSMDELESIPSIGKNIANKIKELLDTGTMANLEKFREKTPIGIREMLKLSGYGPKKIATIWKELEVTTLGELHHACLENRLASIKGFGKKTQDDLIEKIDFLMQNQKSHLWSQAEKIINKVSTFFEEEFPGIKVFPLGDFLTEKIIVEKISLMVDSKFKESILQLEGISSIDSENLLWLNEDGYEVNIIFSEKDITTSSLYFHSGYTKEFSEKNPPYLWDSEYKFDAKTIEKIITEEDIRSVIHCHTTYSDGLHSLKEMVVQAKELGYEYIGVTDHSKSAFYANGLSVDRVIDQWNEIDILRKKDLGIKIFKGIESDILNDGSLDYEDDILKGFDFIIASIHSNLKMDLEKATNRLIKAIENPYTTILGHPTGRLLLSRPGYPIDHKKIIDACAENQVALELNANPWRLDLDYQWIHYAMEKGVKISINPDAHSKEGIKDIRYGVKAARKGMLTKEFCLNTLDASKFGDKKWNVL